MKFPKRVKSAKPAEAARPSTKELVGASTALLVLGVLRRGPTYGYDLVRQINQEAAGLFTWQEGTVYPLLHKLEKQGLVSSRWQESEAGRRRKYYAVTPSGRASLAESAGQWASFHELVARCCGTTAEESTLNLPKGVRHA